MLAEMLSALALPPALPERLTVVGEGSLPSCFPVTTIAASSISAACLAVSELRGMCGDAPGVSVDRRLASLWFERSISPQGWEMPAAWDAIAGDYRTDDGWIKLHTNAPHHRKAALRVLGCAASRAAVGEAVSRRRGHDLEEAVVAAGGCAAALRSKEEWAAHPQGMAVAAEPLVAFSQADGTAPEGWQPTPQRPLAGLRVLDLTRIIAGPVATRFIAGYGAEVLRIDPPGWEEPANVPELTLGKRCARLDLHDRNDRLTFEALLARADLLVHGYRSDALGRLGYGDEQRQAIRPGLIDVSLDAYGHTGPWARRRGFDSLVQFSSGIAMEGMRWRQADAPVSLPVQALDHATGYLLAAAAVRAVIARVREGKAMTARLSLARTARLLMSDPAASAGSGVAPRGEADFAAGEEATPWGPARRLKPPASVDGSPMRWSEPVSRLGSASARWS
jgi:crotonobetainyl-CoA:carnitine CoA-transferase CaiB-like acyl-CoA transferase